MIVISKEEVPRCAYGYDREQDDGGRAAVCAAGFAQQLFCAGSFG